MSNSIVVGEDDDFFKPVSATTSAVEHPKPEDDFATPATHTEEPKAAPLTVTEQAVLNKISALTTNDSAAVTTNDSAAVTTNGTAAPSSTWIRS